MPLHGPAVTLDLVRPRLIPVRLPATPEAVVLVLHGGAGRPDRPSVSTRQLSVQRMIPVAGQIARAAPERLAVHRLLNSFRGWDPERSPVHDVEVALDQLRDQFGPLPVCLVGHSLGGRAALLSGGRSGVRSVVALNPWVYPTDHADLSGRRVLIVHGDSDRVADIAHSRTVAQALRSTADVGFATVKGGKHAMLARSSTFMRLTTDFLRATMLGDVVDGPVAQVLAGHRDVLT